MDTNDKRFQDALHQLTTAFFNFLDVVNPNGVNQTEEIRYISQMLQTLSSHLGGASLSGVQPPQVPASPGNNVSVEVPGVPPTPVTPVEPAPQPIPQVSPQPVPQTTPQASPQTAREFPKSPNMFKSSPFKSESMGRYMFRKLEVNDGDEKCFEFYISGDQGLFAMKPVSKENWRVIYENKERMLPDSVVIVEGEILPSASLECLEPGLVRQDTTSRAWFVEKPCRVRISPA